ncbi:hypothetical protein ABH15_00145 [Methanoculleus taiwanensis]|uniref:DUF3303 domain-containing protein n=1 Tax=Methanoculleus taiwanensis TaxID=1550565 RepID=A0A498H3B8_9EURY|nr:DUF3303 family protein [Methanoculleus taiwanensis]RXE56638.1 hypothetical protein ABH15_00145 [Methanoculleus taiwanensis]
MARFYMRWHLNPLAAPTDQEELAKLWMRMLEMVKADLKEGRLTDWGSCSDASAGYAFAETDEKSLYAAVLKWIPYVVFDIKPVLTVDECIECIQRAAPGK